MDHASSTSTSASDSQSPSFSEGPVTLITGANGGLGQAKAIALARAGHRLILTTRSPDKGQAVANAVRAKTPSAQIELITIDLADIPAVDRVAADLAARYPVIDRLIANAGYAPGTIRLSASGLEESFVAGHLGHMALALGLEASLKRAKAPRVIVVSSDAHWLGEPARFFSRQIKGLSVIDAYADQKLANIYMARCLARVWATSHVRAFSLHPGVVKTGFGSDLRGVFRAIIPVARLFMITPEKGAQTGIFLATAPDATLAPLNGRYFIKGRPGKVGKGTYIPEALDRFWQQSLAALEAERRASPVDRAAH